MPCRTVPTSLIDSALCMPKNTPISALHERLARRKLPHPRPPTAATVCQNDPSIVRFTIFLPAISSEVCKRARCPAATRSKARQAARSEHCLATAHVVRVLYARSRVRAMAVKVAA
jgi:hypothetical protein